jgi:hypothetical protein
MPEHKAVRANDMRHLNKHPRPGYVPNIWRASKPKPTHPAGIALRALLEVMPSG